MPVLRRASREDAMSIDRVVFAFAGTVVLIGVLLSWLVSPWWLIVPAFVGANLLQSAFSGFCPLARILKRFGVKPGAAF
jgi:fatty acid desaturase